jgi:hypothetical protein
LLHYRFSLYCKKENPDVVILVSKTLGDEMKKVLDDATKVVNYIKDQFTPDYLKKNYVKTWTNST